MDRIARIDLYKGSIPLIEPFVISLQTITSARNVFICIESENGLKGWGECSPYETILGETQESAHAVGRMLAPLLVGRPVSAVGANIRLLDATIAGNSCIKSAFDMALFDLAAKEAGLPLFAYLGGENHRKLRTDMTIGLGEARAMADKAAEFIEEGFDHIKVKLGTTFDEDVARIEAIQSTVRDKAVLRLDANQGWDLPTATRILQHLSTMDLKVEWCEAPIAAWNIDGLAQLSRISPIPVMADESLFDHHDAIRHIKKEACPYFNIKLAKSGGLFKARKITAIGEAAGIKLQVGCFSETRLGMTALAHFVLAHPAIIACDMDSFLMLKEDPVEGGLHYDQGGWIEVTEEPGIGCELDISLF